MLSKKFKFVLTVSIILLFGIVSVAQAAPPLQEGDQTESSSLGETLDLDDVEETGAGHNLGTVMSGATGDTDDDTGDDTDGDIGDDQNGDPDDGDGIEDGTMQHPVASALAGFFGVEYEEVFSLHQEENYGFGEIAFAYFFAEPTGLSEEELLQAARESGWGNVLKENGIHPGSIGGNLRSWPEGRNGDDETEEEIELQGSEAEEAGPPAGVGRPEHAGPPEGVGRPDHAGPPAFAGPGGGGGQDGGNGQGGGNNGGGRPSDAGGPGGEGNGRGGRGGQGGPGGGRP